jgi:hypothetical protein
VSELQGSLIGVRSGLDELDSSLEKLVQFVVSRPNLTGVRQA